jgi:Family of unknown function (DUF5758)
MVEHGEFEAWKQCRYGILVRLLIPAEARRLSGPNGEHKCDFARVLEVIGADRGVSFWGDTTYRVGETVRAHHWADQWEASSGGIHFRLTRAEAEAVGMFSSNPHPGLTAEQDADRRRALGEHV